MEFKTGLLDNLRIVELLHGHVTTARAETAPGSAHALDLSELKAPDITFFRPARELYGRFGFVECPPFGTYDADPNSVFMTLKL